MKKACKIVTLGFMFWPQIVLLFSTLFASVRPLRASLFAGVGIVGALACGCASYHAGSGSRQIPGGYRQVAVPVFKNMTEEAGIEVYFTNAMIREIERSRIARVTDKNAAQVTLEGTVESIKYLSTNQIQAGAGAPSEMPSGTVLTTEYRILVNSTIRLRRISDQQVVWQGSFSGERSYLAPRLFTTSLNSSNALYNHSARYQNIQLMAGDMMSEAHDRMTENF